MMEAVAVEVRWQRTEGIHVTFRTWFSGHGGVGLTVGLDDLKGLFQPKRFYDSMIL